ncbi:MAG: hypothetical protein Fur0024_1900 [Patescibacteria group bacterium]
MLQKAKDLVQKAYSKDKVKLDRVLRVIEILKKYELDDEDILVSALLVGIQENSEITNLKILQEFGERVGFITNVLSKFKKPKEEIIKNNFSKENYKNMTFEKYFDTIFIMYVNNLYFGILADEYILFIKLADQIDHLNHLEIAKIPEQKKKIRELMEFFLPMYRKIVPILTKPYLEKYKKMEKELIELIKFHKSRLGMH